VSKSSTRHSTASAPCAGAGSIWIGSSSSSPHRAVRVGTDRGGHPRRRRLAVEHLADPAVHVAADRHHLQAEAQRLDLGDPTGRAGAAREPAGSSPSTMPSRATCDRSVAPAARAAGSRSQGRQVARDGMVLGELQPCSRSATGAARRVARIEALGSAWRWCRSRQTWTAGSAGARRRARRRRGGRRGSVPTRTADVVTELLDPIQIACPPPHRVRWRWSAGSTTSTPSTCFALAWMIRPVGPM